MKICMHRTEEFTVILQNFSFQPQQYHGARRVAVGRRRRTALGFRPSSVQPHVCVCWNGCFFIPVILRSSDSYQVYTNEHDLKKRGNCFRSRHEYCTVRGRTAFFYTWNSHFFVRCFVSGRKNFRKLTNPKRGEKQYVTNTEAKKLFVGTR